MKRYNVIIALAFSYLLTSCNSSKNSTKEQLQRKISYRECSSNVDSLYNRAKILENFASVLNSSIPSYKEVFPEGFYISKNQIGIGFFVWDLTDTLNSIKSVNDCIQFYNYHVYHFAPIEMPWSFSHIAILENGTVKIFKSLNCKDKGDKIQDVIAYINKTLPKSINKHQIVERLNNYRKYGIYTKIDNHSDIICDCDPCN